MRTQTLFRLTLLTLCAVLWLPASSSAQIPVPASPVPFCGQQATPTADSYTVSIDNAAPVPLTMATTVDTRCPVGSTHSFTLAAAAFTVGAHTVRVRAVNVFGATDGPVFTVTVGIAPGQFTIVSVLPPSGE